MRFVFEINTTVSSVREHGSDSESGRSNLYIFSSQYLNQRLSETVTSVPSPWE